MSKKTDVLTKADNNTSATFANSSKFEYCKRKIGGILKSLRKSSDQYLPQKTVDSISDYVSAGDRIIYSELTNVVYTMSAEERGTVATNLESLMAYVMDENNQVKEEIVKVALRLWDHFNLACYQADNATKILTASTEDTKIELYEQLYDRFKGIEKEYITILGIFASVVLAFVGGITFSTSVLQNMAEVGIYRLVLVIILIGFVLVNTINVLLQYIFRLNHAGNADAPIWKVNLVFGILLLAVIIAWLLSMHDFPEYIRHLIPWSA